MKRAFSLIELLTVIGIIVILVGVLLPVLATAREQSRRARCLSNQRQLGGAVALYRADWDDCYPAELGLVWDYVHADRVWECPSDCGEIFPEDPAGCGRRGSFYEGMGTSFLYYGTSTDVLFCVTDHRSAAWHCPAVAPLLHEMRPWHDAVKDHELILTSPARYNICFADGHFGRKSAARMTADVREAMAPH